jgi:hypothetical protein
MYEKVWTLTEVAVLFLAGGVGITLLLVVFNQPQ